MRFHEFYCIVKGKVVEIQTLWDITEVILQAGAWPMAPSLGREWHVPATRVTGSIAFPVGDV